MFMTEIIDLRFTNMTKEEFDLDDVDLMTAEDVDFEVEEFYKLIEEKADGDVSEFDKKFAGRIYVEDDDDFIDFFKNYFDNMKDILGIKIKDYLDICKEVGIEEELINEFEEEMVPLL